jgi:hypothetical protein
MVDVAWVVRLKMLFHHNNEDREAWRMHFHLGAVVEAMLLAA